MHLLQGKRCGVHLTLFNGGSNSLIVITGKRIPRAELCPRGIPLHNRNEGRSYLQGSRPYLEFKPYSKIGNN